MKSILIASILASTLFSAEPLTTVGDLQWQDEKLNSSKKLKHAKAISYCDALKVGGFNDFRLPTKEELASTIDKTIYPRTKTFKHVTDFAYWTSTPYKNSKHFVYGVNYEFGSLNAVDKGDKNYIRCVRSSASK